VGQATNPPSPVFVGDGIVLINDFEKVWKFDLGKQTYLDLEPLPRVAAVDCFVRTENRMIASGENFIEPPKLRSEWVLVGRFVDHE
jgi:hypothetical protein